MVKIPCGRVMRVKWTDVHACQHRPGMKQAERTPSLSHCPLSSAVPSLECAFLFSIQQAPTDPKNPAQIPLQGEAWAGAVLSGGRPPVTLPPCNRKSTSISFRGTFTQQIPVSTYHVLGTIPRVCDAPLHTTGHSPALQILPGSLRGLGKGEAPRPPASAGLGATGWRHTESVPPSLQETLSPDQGGTMPSGGSTAGQGRALHSLSRRPELTLTLCGPALTSAGTPPLVDNGGDTCRYLRGAFITCRL